MTGDDAAKVANSVIDGLKTQPLALALIVMNVVFIGIGYLIWTKTQQVRSDYVTQIMRSCLDIKAPPTAFGPGSK